MPVLRQLRAGLLLAGLACPERKGGLPICRIHLYAGGPVMVMLGMPLMSRAAVVACIRWRIGEMLLCQPVHPLSSCMHAEP